MTQGFARCLCLLLGCLLAACTTRTDAQEKDMGLDPATAAYQKYGYNDRSVEAHLGPHAYMIPANYFRNQIGPDFQGNFSLLVQWPDLQPLPPGERSKQDTETFAKQVTISPYYVDRVPIESRLERAIQPLVPETSPSRRHPGDHLELMDEQSPVFGLTPYWVNAARFAEYWKMKDAESGHRSQVNVESQRDWYLARDADGRVTTVIKCDSHLRPDGFVIQGEHVTRDGNRSTGCDHEIVIADDKILLSISYARVFLKDWKEMEQRAKELFSQYRVR